MLLGSDDELLPPKPSALSQDSLENMKMQMTPPRTVEVNLCAYLNMHMACEYECSMFASVCPLLCVLFVSASVPVRILACMCGEFAHLSWWIGHSRDDERQDP